MRRWAKLHLAPAAKEEVEELEELLLRSRRRNGVKIVARRRQAGDLVPEACITLIQNRTSLASSLLSPSPPHSASRHHSSSMRERPAPDVTRSLSSSIRTPPSSISPRLRLPLTPAEPRPAIFLRLCPWSSISYLLTWMMWSKTRRRNTRA